MASVSFFLQFLFPPLLLALHPLPCLPLLLISFPLSFLIHLFLSLASPSYPCPNHLSLSLSPVSSAFLNHFDICQIHVALLSQAISFFFLSNVLKNNFRQLPSFQCALVPRKSRMFTLLRKLIVTFRHKPSLNFPPNSSGLLDNPHSSFLSSLIFQKCSFLSCFLNCPLHQVLFSLLCLETL